MTSLEKLCLAIAKNKKRKEWIDKALSVDSDRICCGDGSRCQTCTPGKYKYFNKKGGEKK